MLLLRFLRIKFCASALKQPNKAQQTSNKTDVLNKCLETERTCSESTAVGVNVLSPLSLIQLSPPLSLGELAIDIQDYNIARCEAINNTGDSSVIQNSNVSKPALINTNGPCFTPKSASWPSVSSLSDSIVTWIHF